MKIFNKEKIKSLRFLIFIRLIIYLVIMSITFVLFFYLISEATIIKMSRNFMTPILESTHKDIEDYKSIDGSILFKNAISLEVVDSNLNVIYTKGFIEDPISKYSPVDFAYIINSDTLDYNVLTRTVLSDTGEELTLIYKQHYTNAVIKKLATNMLQYILILVTGSILLLAVSYILLIRNIFRSIKKEFDFIQTYISKTPYDRTKLDLSKIPLLETREVTKSYNNMLDEMDKIRNEKDRLVNQQNTLISNLSHDLKSPITSLLGYWDIIKSDDISGEERKQYAKYIDNSLNDLNQLITMLFEQIRFQHSEYNLDYTEDDLNGFLRDICANYYILFDNRGFSMDIQIAEEPFITCFDMIHMKRVFTNILDNCLKHNEDATELTVETVINDDVLTIYFKDNGVGISQKDRDKIFDAFYQGDQSRTKSHGGLGLYIVRQIVIKHGGTIDLLLDTDYSVVFKIEMPRKPRS